MKKDGFTFIEIIVVLAILILMSFISFANYGSFNQRKDLDQNAKQLAGVLRLSQKKAIAGDFDPDTCTNFGGYRVNFVSTSSYRLEQSCNGAWSQPSTLSPYNVTSSNIVINPKPTIAFDPLSGKNTSNAEDTITVKSTTTNLCIDIIISSLGVITENASYAC